MTDTPRTDAVAFTEQVCGEVVEADFCRAIERELLAAFSCLSGTPRVVEVDCAKSPDTNGHDGWKMAYFTMLTLARQIERENYSYQQEATEQRNIAASYLIERDELSAGLKDIPGFGRRQFCTTCGSYGPDRAFESHCELQNCPAKTSKSLIVCQVSPQTIADPR